MPTFADADIRLYHNDRTATKDDFQKNFTSLYKLALRFEMVLAVCLNGQTLWELWHDFAKAVRNHLAHGIRGHGSDWLGCGVRINQCLLIELDSVTAKLLGDSSADDLAKLRPRMPAGRKGVNIPNLFGRKRGGSQD